jgi:hypothetical protein
MAKQKDTQNLPANFKPVWNETEQRFDFVDTGEPMLTRKDHQVYDKIVDGLVAKAEAKAEGPSHAKALAGIGLVCAVPTGSRIYCVNNRLFIAMPGQQPVELINGQLQELRLASIAALQK